jgi:hypothetical protein
MTLQSEIFTLTPLEHAILKRFRTLTKVDLLDTFTSDDFRLYGLDKHFTNPQQDIGSFFAKLVHHHHIHAVGRKRSVLPKNNMREIKEYEWTHE